jgi:arsenate reductase-like glutaredoxin family protein
MSGTNTRMLHNPACGKPRNTPAPLRNSGVEPVVVECLKTPVRMNRPIVVTPPGTRWCHPSEAVPDILPSPQLAPLAKEDGEPPADATFERTGRCVAA